jgi:puromycin-sensitive aminopeptidase
MQNKLRRGVALSLSTWLAASPATGIAANLAERPVTAPVDITARPAGLELAKPLTLPEASLTVLPTAMPISDAAPLLNASAAASPSITTGLNQAATPTILPQNGAQASPESPMKELAGTGEKIVSSESPMATGNTLGGLYDKSKAGTSAQPTNAAPFSSPPPSIPTQVLKGGRLPRDIKPKSYRVSLRVDPSNDGFSGKVAISVDVVKPTNQIVLHSLGHTISAITVDGQAVPVTSAVTDPASETLTITLPAALKAGPASVEIAYSGAYNKQMRGLYESKAKFEGKEEKYAFTHLEPTNARRVFPMFDEPDFKAEFSLTVEAPEHLTVLSNMPPESRTTSNGWQTVTFGKTPTMSTYLFALAVARLVPQSRMVDGTKVTVWTMPQDAGQAGFALDVAENALKRLNKYFGVKYQLPKMDLVAVPDFSAGAMENWGAIFFRDSALLIDRKLSSTKARKRVAETVTHEIVHMWFGDLVTMKWWNDLWLNEAFATWMAYKIVAPWKPEFNEWIEFEQRKREPLSIDALKTTRAISAGVSSTSEIQAQFDPLTYSKGGALLRMIEGYLGETKFRKGIAAYMRRYQYGNTEAADLWRELEKASGVPVVKMAEDWLGKPGYPVVSVKSMGRGNRLKLSQNRFSASGSSSEPTAWTIPVVFKYQLKGEKQVRVLRTILKTGHKTINLPGKGTIAWLYPNQDETGFYRVRLEGNLLSALRAKGLPALSALERMGLLNHLWAQAKSGDLPIASFLDTLQSLKADQTRVVLEEVSGYLKAIAENLAASPEDKASAKRMSDALLSPHWKRLGWDAAPSEDDEPRLARAAVLSALGTVAPTPALQSGLKQKLAAYLADPAKIDPAIAAPVLNLNARLGQADFADYAAHMARAVTPEQRDSLLVGLSQFRDPAAAKSLLAMTLTDAIRGQDVWKVYGPLLANTAVQGETWEFVKANWQALKEKLGPRGSQNVIGATASLQSRRWLSEVGAFFNEPANNVPSAQRTLNQTLEAIELGVRFKEAQAPVLSQWLQSHYPAKP